MKKNIRLVLLCFLGLIFAGSSAVYAKEVLSVTNRVDTGVIDIELEEYQKKANGKLESWEDGAFILPGKTISKIPRITNVGYDCYVRAKLDFTIEELENTYFGMGSDWIYGQDGYWYFTKILKSGDWVDIFQGVQIPDDFNQKYEGEKISLRIDVDAIQVQNFIPDYEKEHPWGTVEIQQCIRSAPYRIQSLEVKFPKAFEIQYDKETRTLIKNEDDFFSNIPVLFPGDVYTDTLELFNESGHKVKIYFTTYSEQSDLLKQITLRIVLHNKGEELLVYEGPLASKTLEQWMLLTEIADMEGQQLIYTIEVPDELDNAYTLLNDQVRWMFSVEALEETVKTGDDANLYLSFSLMLVSGIIFLTAAFFWRSSLKKEVSI